MTKHQIILALQALVVFALITAAALSAPMRAARAGVDAPKPVAAAQPAAEPERQEH